MKKNKQIYDIEFFELKEEQQNLITGLLLGDGSIHRRKNTLRNANLSIMRSEKDFEYLKLQASILNELLSNAGIKIFKKFDKRTNKYYNSCYLSTIYSKMFTQLYEKWYPNRTKCVPKDVVLNREIITTWFCDDGTVSTKGSPYIFEIQFATNSFSLEDVVFLTEQLRSIYNENFFINKSKTNQYTIHGASDATRTLLYDIDTIFPDAMKRKSAIWRNDAARFYSNQPTREKREKDIIDFIMNNDGFSKIELGFGIGAYIIRKDRNTNEVLYHFINPYLEKYLNNKYLVKYNERFYLTELGIKMLPLAHFTELKYC